ncbi:MAG: hypothetical protein Q6354_04415 [Candidatus Brocadiales bacterium]|nr:hypothetical protein [Candidatus Brocadiales bacterium]
MAKPQPERDERQRVIEAFRLADYFVVDLITGTEMHEFFLNLNMNLGENTRETLIALHVRMVYSFLIITLTKYLEWYARFKDIIPRESREGCKKLYVKLSEKLQLRKFRNKVVAHIIDDDTGRPLTPEEVDKLFREFVDKVKEDLNDSVPGWRERVKEIFGNRELDIFCLWVNSQGANPQDPVNTIQTARDAIRKKYNLTNDELFPGLHSL